MKSFRKMLLLLVLSSTVFTVTAQQLYLEGFTARQRTNYDMSPYQQSQIWYSPLGFRVAGGADKVQIGGEVRFNLKDPKWTIRDTATNIALGTHTFISSYYGALVRVKFSRYPARRFGLNIIAGAGLTNMERRSNVDTEPASISYAQTPTYNGTVGISIPTGKRVMVELGYSYFFIDFKQKQELPKMNGSFHSFHLGFSYNFVFGKRATEYEKILKG